MASARKNRTASNGQLFDARTFVVEGDGRFFVDGLRYDSAWPATESDSRLVLGDYDADRRAVTLKTRWPGAPTVDRWQSRGWTVTQIDGVQVAPSKLAVPA